MKAFEEANGIKVPYEIVGRRPGDIAECYADASKAKRELGWEAKEASRTCARMPGDLSGTWYRLNFSTTRIYRLILE